MSDYLFIFLMCAHCCLSLLSFFLSDCTGSSLLRVGYSLVAESFSPASHCRGFSHRGAQALGTWGSVAAGHWLSCSVACGVFQEQGLN